MNGTDSAGSTVQSEIEEWLPVTGWKGLYEVSSLGRVQSLARVIARTNGAPHRHAGGILKPYLGSTGYLLVRLRDGEAHRALTAKVHRLVALAFIPTLDENLDVNHIDGAKRNNCRMNLEWMTRSENIHHAMVNGLGDYKPPRHSGHDHYRSRFSPADIDTIRQSPLSARALARQYGSDHGTIRQIISRRSYRD